MNFRSIFYVCCFVSFASSFIPRVVQCMEGSSANPNAKTTGLEETSPMDIDPSVFEGVEQIVDFGGCEESVEIFYPVNNPQNLEIGIGILINLSKNQSLEAKQKCLSLAGNLIKGIEKIYKQNEAEIRAIIQKNRDELNPELRRIFDSWLDRCNEKMQRFASCHACSVCTTVAFFSFIIYFVLKEIYL